MSKSKGSLDSQLKDLPDLTILPEGSPKAGTAAAVAAPSDGGEQQKTLQQACREEIENLHGIFVCWFKGLQPKEELEKELLDRITTNFSHVAPNGQFLKGRANLLHSLNEKYKAYPMDAFDIQIESVKVIWAHNDLCLVTYEEWQWWRDVESGSSSNSNMNTSSHSNANDSDVVRFGRLTSCLLKQRPGSFHWVHVHETWLEGVGPNDALNIYSDKENSESSGAYDVEVTYQTGVVNIKEKRNSSNSTTENATNDNGGSQVRFNNEREEVSYAYKKAQQDGESKSVPKDSAKKHSKKKSKEKNKVKNKVKPVVMLTPVPPQAQAPSNASRRRHISPQLTDHAKACMVNNELIGISIKGWDIGTGQGPMGDEGWFSAATTNFENIAQYGSASSSSARRRVALPEMVFPAAHVAFEHRKNNVWISWDVLDALDDWAKAHQKIPLGSDKEENGVSVLKSEDADLWAKKNKNIIPDSSKSKDNFHFDWTYSSPFCGSVEGGFWQPIPESGLKLDMLKDKSVPILFFDELVLYEDDLHDNGQVQFSLKIRVMPTCGFILARLWVRIDRVLLRLKETRILFEFGKTADDPTHVYRDVTWKECHWKDLSEHNLPTNLRVWATEGQETPQLAMLMSKLPEIALPNGIHKHAVLKLGGDADC